MKYQIISLAWLISLLAPVQAVEEDLIERALSQLQKALNQQQYEIIEPNLSPDFEFSGYQGDMATMIMKQVITQYPKNIENIDIKSVAKAEENGAVKLFLTTNFNYQSEQGIETESIQLTLDENYLFTSAPVVNIAVAGHGNDVNKNQSKIKTISQAMVVPFTQRGRLIFVKAKVNNTEGEFILDSGASGIVLNQQRFGDSVVLGETSPVTANGVGGAVKNITSGQLKSFQWQDILLTDLKVDLANMDHFEISYQTPICGIIGSDVFKQYLVEYDYANKKVTLHPGDQQPNWNQKPILELDVTMVAHLPVVTINVDGNELLLGIDSGAEGAMIATKWRELLDPYFEFIKNEELIGLDNNKKMTEVVKLSQFKLAERTFTDHKFTIADINWGHQSIIDGLLGFEFLSGQRTAIDVNNKKLYLWP